MGTRSQRNESLDELGSGRMIYGIGTDIVSVSRIEQAMKRHGARFSERILMDSELIDLQQLKDPERFIAKRFAAKEAFSKAIGLGMKMPMTWQRMGIGHDDLGKPIMLYHPELKAYLDAQGITVGHVSITDEKDYAVAFVVLEKGSL